MKKIFFNDRYGLTQAVIEGRKTMERKGIRLADYDVEYLDTAFDWDLRESVIIDRYAQYKVGEVVAVAQSYKTLTEKRELFYESDAVFEFIKSRAGWANKMFVRADFMPHQIRITNIKVERLQDISYEDCLKEGIEFASNGRYYVNYDIVTHNRIWLERDIKSSFAHLIGSISGKGTWESNPWVFAYTFELIK